ncbi:MAG: hypothetical protein AAF805_01430 [Planctomycetota bacterium]
MIARWVVCLAAAAAVSTSTTDAPGRTVVIDEGFENYTDQAAFEAAWPADSGSGFARVPQPVSTLVSSPDGVPGQQGQAAVTQSFGVNESAAGYDPLDMLSGFFVAPAPEQDVVLRGDVYLDAAAGVGTRASIGLRNDRFDRDPSGVAQGINFVEVGSWNQDVCLPTVAFGACGVGDPTRRAASGFSFRLNFFDASSAGRYFENGVDRGMMQRLPDWQHFPLDPRLDDPNATLPNGSSGNGDGVVTIDDVGSGWHRFSASIGQEAVRFSLDLYRDGLNNATGLAGVDATVLVEVEMSEAFNPPPFDLDPAPLNSLRFGGPSGLANSGLPAYFDNLYLAVTPEPSAAVLLLTACSLCGPGRRQSVTRILAPR